MHKCWAKQIYSYEQWRIGPKIVIFDAFGFELPSMPPYANKSQGDVQSTVMHWTDVRLARGSSDRTKWEKWAHLQPFTIKGEENDTIYQEEKSYVDTVVSLGANEPEDLEEFIQKRVNKTRIIEENLAAIDILLVKLIEIHIQNKTMGVALGIIKSILWEKEGSLLLFKMLEEQKCFSFLDEILEHPTLDRTSLEAHIYLGYANMDKLKQNYTDAAFHFEAVMKKRPTEPYAMALFSCYYSVGDTTKLQFVFDHWFKLIKSPKTKLFWEGRLAELKCENTKVKEFILRLKLQKPLPHSIKKWIDSQKY